MSEDIFKIGFVADYGSHDLAFNEVQQKIHEEAARRGLKVRVDAISANAFDTTQTAFLIGDLAQKSTADGGYDVVYHNTAPRFDAKKQTNNSGEGLAHTVVNHENGTITQVVGVFSGNGRDGCNTFSQLPADAQGNLHAVDCPNEGTQFRSRDIYVAHVLDALENKIRLKETALRVPAAEPESITPAELEHARGVANARLSELNEGNFNAHGDSSKGYVTIIGPKDKLADQIRGGATEFFGREIDALALKTDQADKKAGHGNGRWIEAGFAVAQLALNSTAKPQRTIVAFTKDNSDFETSALYEATLDNGVVIQTDDVRALAYVKDRVTYLGHEVAKGDYDLVDLDTLPGLAPLPAGITPAYIDGYGNIKIGLTKQSLIEHLQAQSNALGDEPWTFPLPAGDRVAIDITINGETKKAALTQASFDLEPGEIAVSSGSSGWTKTKDAPENEKLFFAEFFTRGQSTASGFGAQVGDEVTVTYKGISHGNEPKPEVERHDGNTAQRSTDLGKQTHIGG